MIMTFLKVLIFCGISFFSLAGWTGDEKCNGGVGLLCQGSDLQILDLYEGKNVRGLSIISSRPDWTYKEYLESIFSKLQKYNPTRAEIYRKQVEMFLSETKFVDGMSESNDIGAIEIPKNCQLVQLALQSIPSLPGDKRYLVNKAYWEILSERDKAGLILHEIIARELSLTQDYKHINTKFIRYLNATLFSEEFDRFNFPDYIDLLLTAKVNIAETIDGVPFQIVDSSGKFQTFFFERSTSNNLGFAYVVNDIDFTAKVFGVDVLATETLDSNDPHGLYFNDGYPSQFLIKKAVIQVGLKNKYLNITSTDRGLYYYYDSVKSKYIFTPTWAKPGENIFVCDSNLKKIYELMNIWVVDQKSKKQCGCYLEVSAITKNVLECY